MQDLIKNKNIFIKTLGSGPKIRVGQVTVNIGFFFLALPLTHVKVQTVCSFSGGISSIFTHSLHSTSNLVELQPSFLGHFQKEATCLNRPFAVADEFPLAAFHSH